MGRKEGRLGKRGEGSPGCGSAARHRIGRSQSREVVAHEVAHAAIDFAATGTVASCGLGPWTYRAGRLVTCYGTPNVGAWNNFLTPLLMATAGIGAMQYSENVSNPGVR